MYNNVDSFDSFDNIYSAYSPLGRNFGQPHLNFAMRHLLGQNYMPVSDNGQSMYEAMLQRNRSTDFMNLQRSGLMNNGMLNRVGLGSHPALGQLSVMASPDSALARTISPFIGGNPMAAQMQVYAGLAGAGVMGNFGRMGAISAGETENVMQSLENRFYTQQAYGGPKGVKEELKERGKEAFRSIARGPDANKIFADLGFSGVEVGKFGRLNAKGEQVLKNFDITADNPDNRIIDAQKSARTGNASMLSAELDSALKEGEGKIDEKTQKRILDRVQKTLHLSGEELDKFKTEDTRGVRGRFKPEIDVAAFRAEMAKLKESTPFDLLREEDAAAFKTGGLTKGFNFEKSRGFKLEDFTSGFIKAADLRMLGDRKGQSIAAGMSDFTGSAGGALSAARAVFGNKSGAELVAKISNIAGPEVNLGTQEGADKVEGLLRKVNATARVAGLSIKTMLSIIDAGKQLAANHPALHSTSSEAIANLAMKAVGTAVALGSTMSAADYRRAGGGQGIATQEMKTALEFAAGPVGGTIAAAYYGATAEQTKQLDAMIGDTPITGRALDNGMRANMAKIRGISIGTLHRLASDNPQLTAEAMKVTHIADRMVNATKPAITAAMLDHLDRVGLSTSTLTDTYKNANGDFSSVDAKVRQYLVTDQDKSVWQHAKIGVQEKLEDSIRSIPQKAAYARFVKLRDDSAKDEANMDQKYGSKYAPMITQAIDVLASGTESKDMAEALTRIFATGNDNSAGADAALKAAQDAGKKITKIAGQRGKTDAEKINKGGLHGALNDFIRARKDAGTETGDTSATGGLGSLTKEELENASTMGGQMDLKNSEDALAELKAKEAGEAAGTLVEGEKKRLATLRTWKKAGIIDFSSSIRKAQLGGVSAFSSAAIDAAYAAKNKKNYTAASSDILSGMGSSLDALTGSGGRVADDLTYLNNYYTDKEGKVDYAKMLSEKSKSEGAFSDEKGLGKRHWDDSSISQTLSSYQEKLDNAAQITGINTATSPDLQSRGDLPAMIEKLIKVLNEGLGLKDLISAINSI